MVMNEENRKKILIGSIIGVITLVIAVVGATYAFFSLNVSGDTTSTNVDIETGNADVVTIEQGAENIHINLAVSDMAENNPNKAYYATDTDDNYKLTEEDGTLTFATITGSNKEASDCTAKVTITMDTSNDSMGEALKNNDAILHLESGEYQEDIDLSTLLTEGSSSVTEEVEVEISVSETNSPTIQGYLKVNNTIEDQSYLAGRTLNITITVDNLECGIAKGLPAIEQILKYSESSHLEGDRSLKRFVGEYTEVTDNFICFGTDDIETCKNNLDQYMYRIIKIDETNNQVKVIKATMLVKGTTRTFSWGGKYGDRVTWENSDPYKFLNSTDSSESYFMGNPYYRYMQDQTWFNLIIEHPTWNVGDYYSPSYQSATLAAAAESKETLENGSPVSLMNISDYLSAGPFDPSDGPNNWLYIKNGLNGESNTGTPLNGELQQVSGYDELTMTGFSHSTVNTAVHYISHGFWNQNYNTSKGAIRPVFYLDGSKVILGGRGTFKRPYYVYNFKESISSLE